MGQQLVITLSEAATEEYLRLARQQTAAMLEEGCEPSDVLLKIVVAANSMFDSTAYFRDIEIGEVSVDLVGNEQA